MVKVVISAWHFIFLNSSAFPQYIFFDNFFKIHLRYIIFIHFFISFHFYFILEILADKLLKYYPLIHIKISCLIILAINRASI